MPTPLVAAASAVVVALGGVGVGSMMLDSGGTSSAASSTVPSLAADPTGRPAHARFVYTPPGQRSARCPQRGPIQGQAPDAGAAPGEGAPYVARGQPQPPLGRVPAPAPSVQATTWQLYLSGGDLLQPDPGCRADASERRAGARRSLFTGVGRPLASPCDRFRSPCTGRSRAPARRRQAEPCRSR